MKTTAKYILLFALIAGFLIFPGCTQEPEVKETVSSDSSIYQEQVGSTVAEACQAFGISETQVRQALADGSDMPALGQIEYADHVWTVYPCFDSKTEIMYGYSYRISYPEDPDQAAPVFTELLTKLGVDHGAPKKESSPFRYGQEITTEAVLNHIWSNRTLQFERRWALEQDTSPKTLEALKNLGEAYPLFAPLVLTYGVILSYTADLDAASLTLTYRFFPFSDFPDSAHK